MQASMNKNKESRKEEIKYRGLELLSLFVFGVLILFLILINFDVAGLESYRDLYGDFYGILAFLGGLIGLFVSRRWGHYHSLFGRAILFLSFGLLAQVFGQISYSYYFYVLGVYVPYPSVGDIGYFGSIPLYIIGVYYLARVCGVKYGMSNINRILQSIIIPLLVLFFSYVFLLMGYSTEGVPFLTVLLDFAYPIGQVVYISMALLVFMLSRGILGGIMKKQVIVLLTALAVQYIADYSFLYRNNRDIWQSAGMSDFFYTVAYLLMTLAILEIGKRVSIGSKE